MGLLPVGRQRDAQAHCLPRPGQASSLPCVQWPQACLLFVGVLPKAFGSDHGPEGLARGGPHLRHRRGPHQGRRGSQLSRDARQGQGRNNQARGRVSPQGPSLRQERLGTRVLGRARLPCPCPGPACSIAEQP